MRRIFWIGNPFFHAALRQYGFEVHYFNFKEFTTFTWNDIVNMLGYEPDVVVVADKSMPPFVLGVESFPCLTVFYAVDTHIHSWYDLYAQAFDICLVSLHDHKTFFQNKYLPDERIMWSAPCARDTDAPKPHIEAKWDCLFVGNVNDDTLPRRVQFFEELAEYVPTLHITSGSYVDLYAEGRVLINQCEHDDLNFRVFEALGCGGCLVTPRVAHGFPSLFSDGEELMTYEPHNAMDAAKVIKILLNNHELRVKIARQGLELVNAKHRAKHRAWALVDLMDSIGDWNKIIINRLSQAQNIRHTWLKQIYLLFANVLDGDALRNAYLKAARGDFSKPS